MSIQSQINSLISQAGGYMVAQKKEQMAVEKTEANAAEKAERETKRAQEAERRNQAYESLAEQLKTANEQSKGMQERINYLSSARGAAEVIGEAGLLSNKRQRELVRAAQKKEGDV